MGLLSTLWRMFGGAAPNAAPAPQQAMAAARTTGATSADQQERQVKIRADWITVSARKFSGSASFSPNGRWIVGLNDSDGKGRGGFREQGNGRVLLADFERDTVAHELGSFARPMDAAVSNSGAYIVHDSGFGSALRGTLVAISPDGREDFRRDFSANIYNIGLSACGRYAVVQTAHAPGADGNLLEVMDLRARARLFALPPATGWANAYEFDVSKDGVLEAFWVVHDKLGRFRYSASGEFEHVIEFRDAKLRNGDCAQRIWTVQALLADAGTVENARLAIRTADKALVDGVADMSDWAAAAHRLRGESFELLGEPANALAAFDQALALNPKIGVRKRATALRKKLGNPAST